jgi:hypothetical protein
MKLERKIYDNGIIRFEEVRRGSCFICSANSEEVFMKIDVIPKSGIDINAVNLITGEVSAFNKNSYVYAVEVAGEWERVAE